MLIYPSSTVVPFEPKRSGRFLRLSHDVLHSWQWKRLHAKPRCLYIELASRFTGFNNGLIEFSNRDAAAALHCSQPTACRAFHALERLGFIVCTKRGSFSLKTRQAKGKSTWRLPAYD